MRKLTKLAPVLAICLIFLLCVGCTDITPHQLRKAEKICGDRDGVQRIRGNTLKPNTVQCGDDTWEFIAD